jgi:hypothetical protein
MSGSSPDAGRSRVSVVVPNEDGVRPLDFAIAYRRPGATLAGYLSLLPCLAHVWRERRRVGAGRRIDPGEVDRLLTTRMREPPLRLLLRRQLGRLLP